MQINNATNSVCHEELPTVCRIVLLRQLVLELDDVAISRAMKPVILHRIE